MILTLGKPLIIWASVVKLYLVIGNRIFQAPHGHHHHLHTLKAYDIWKTISYKDLVSFSLKSNGFKASKFYP